MDEVAGGDPSRQQWETHGWTNDDQLGQRTAAFDIYELKVTPCPKRFTHDWTACPYAHLGERAARRDVRAHSYTGIACVAMKQEGKCALGDRCPYAHSAWEYWLHPTRYHTEICKQGVGCTRKICFFAHRPEELRKPLVRPGVNPESVALSALSTLASLSGPTTPTSPPPPPPPPRPALASAPLLHSPPRHHARTPSGGSGSCDTGLGSGGMPAAAVLSGLAASGSLGLGTVGSPAILSADSTSGLLGTPALPLPAQRAQPPAAMAPAFPLAASMSRLSSLDSCFSHIASPTPTTPPYYSPSLTLAGQALSSPPCGLPLDQSALLPADLFGASAATAGAGELGRASHATAGAAARTSTPSPVDVTVSLSQLGLASEAPSTASAKPGSTAQAVMAMLGQGKLSAGQAAELLSSTLPPEALLELQLLLQQW